MHIPWFSTDERDFARYRSNGDAAALARVFDRNAPALLALARHLAPRGLEAEDLVQATFLTAIEKRGGCDARRRVGPWLAGILGHHARAARRRALRAAELPADDVSALGAEDGRDGGPEFVVQLGLAHSTDVTVVDTEDQPVADVQVLALPAGGPWQRYYRVGAVESLPVHWTKAYEAALRARTDKDGRARFPHLPLLPPPDMGLCDGARIYGEGVECGQYSFAVASATYATHTKAVALVALPQREGALLVPTPAAVAQRLIGDFPAPRHVVERR